MTDPKPYSKFLEICCVLMGGVVGLLIALPLALSDRFSNAAIPPNLQIIAMTAFGIAVGYRRRKSRVFLYFAMVAILVLSILVTAAMKPA